MYLTRTMMRRQHYHWQYHLPSGKGMLMGTSPRIGSYHKRLELEQKYPGGRYEHTVCYKQHLRRKP